MSSSHDSPPPTAPNSAARTGPRWVFPAVLGAVLALVSVGVFFRVMGRAGLPAISRSNLEQATEAWRKREVRDYDLAVRVTARQGGLYRVRVRDGKAVEATRDDWPLPKHETWTVEGMLETLERDFATSEGSGPEGANRGCLRILCRFDPEYGYPAAYQRIEWGGGPEIAWEVVEFTPVTAR